MQRDGWVITRLTAGKTVQITPGRTFHARSAARLENCDTQSPHAEGAAGNPLAPPSCFSCCKLAILSQDFPPPVPIPKKGLVIRNNFKQSLQKSARCPQPAPKTILRTAGAGASEFLVVKRQGARCLAQNNYKLHALLHFINLS